MSPWTKERTAKLQELRSSGYAASEIASVMNKIYGTDFTRNSIIGKCGRMHIPTPVRRADGTRIRERGNQNRTSKKIFVHKLKLLRESVESELEAGEICDLPPDQSPNAVTFAELAEQHCRWPLADKRYCGDKRVEVRTHYGNKLHGNQKLMPYCPRHCRVAYR